MREYLPWLHLFQCLQLSLDFRKIVLAAIGVVVTSLGCWAIIRGSFGDIRSPDAMSISTPTDEASAIRDAGDRVGDSNQAWRHELRETSRMPWEPVDEAVRPDPYRWPIQQNARNYWGIPDAAFLVFEPLYRLLLPVVLTLVRPDATWVGLLLTIWTILVWAFIGGTITRMAAMQVARDTRVGLMDAIRFTLSRYLSYVGASVLPFVGIFLIVLMTSIAGLMLRVPGLDMIAGLFWWLVLGAGLCLSLAVLGLSLGWPLMYAAIGAEATESFEAMSRSYSYVLGRPWRYLFYAVVAVLHGMVSMTIVVALAYAVIWFSQYAASWGGGFANLRSLYSLLPEVGHWRRDFGSSDAVLTGTTRTTAILIGFWAHFVLLGVVGIAHSFFWCATTIIYFLLRRDVDDTELDEVFIEESDEEPFPTVTPWLGPEQSTGAAPTRPMPTLDVITPPNPPRPTANEPE